MIRITIKTDNAAFEHSPVDEVARILAGLVRRLHDSDWKAPGLEIPLRDINGNTVGKFAWTDDPI